MSLAPAGLPLPSLDDRRWDDLVAEALTLIPLYAPGWTDYNASDPGITLIELLAWVVEQQVFRIDRVGRAGLLKLLKLAGGVAAGPVPARSVLSVKPAANSTGSSVAAGTEFVGTTPDGDPLRFQAIDRVTLADLALASVQTQDGGAYIDRSTSLSRGHAVPIWGDDPGPGSAFVLGFDAPKPLSTSDEFSLYFVVRDPTESDADRAALLKESGAAGTNRHHSVRLAWEAWTPTGLWVPLDARDETRALTLNGRVLLKGSDLMAKTTLGREAKALYYVRARIASGRHDAAPQLRAAIANAVVVEQAVIPLGSAPLNPHPPEGMSPPGDRFERLGPGDGWPGQVRTVGAPQIAHGEVRVLSHRVTKTEDVWTAWRRRDDFDASRRTSSDFVADSTLGTITFGDGENGRAPHQGEEFFASYLSTAADAGNVAAGTINYLSNTDKSIDQITQPIAAWGGRPGETVDDVRARVLNDMTAVRRSVTLEDCEQLAREVPGAAVALARATAESHPDLPGVPCPGVVLMVILPTLPADAPAPTPGLCCLVSRYLNRRGVPGTRIEVAGPIYRRLLVTATIGIGSGSSSSTVLAAARAALFAFFNPLSGGPGETGWTIGRNVYHAEVLGVLGAVTGVTGVTSLTMALDGGEPLCGNVCIGPRGLPKLDPPAFQAAASTTRDRRARS